ncbi:NAD(P)-dependent oxidoreductase [Colwellia sp. M166]|uniref:NAD-dependent epimerase/dehydratase family protein n=1 Tax=Colwellia sp. M166 TaxID=2583805 RepID=UPI00211EDB03|nr:NAD(P)-dependent oxidoreductase [Colwellia sp. M166]UUO23126.1 NAD(P)-dependent oxidoreductase [Colwellia sp. M166]|tara:strand:- start:30166 stop:30987 length:822 start_codon:yes stop_codon:yes gene_type:complete
MTKTVLVTGANGFVGNQVVKSLVEKNCHVKAVVRNNKKTIFAHTSVEIILTNDLFQESELRLLNILSGVDVVIHCAWYVEPGKYLYSEENFACVTGTIAMAKAAIKAGVTRFIGLGTCFEYDVSQKLLSVKTPLKPNSIYAEAKVETFHQLSKLFNETAVDFLWCRLFYLFGEGEDERRLAAYVHSQLHNNQEVELSDGKQIRDFIDVKEAAIMIVDFALSHISGAKNICSGKGITVRAFVEKIADEYGKKDLLKFGARLTQKDEPLFIVGVN